MAVVVRIAVVAVEVRVVANTTWAVEARNLFVGGVTHADVSTMPYIQNSQRVRRRGVVAASC